MLEFLFAALNLPSGLQSNPFEIEAVEDIHLIEEIDVQGPKSDHILHESANL